MPRQAPEPDPGDEQAAASAGGQPGLARAPGAAEAGPVTGDAADAGAWLSGLDGQALLDGLAAGGFLDGDPDGQDAALAEEQDAAADGRMSAPLSAGRAGALAVEHMPPGPAQAGWLAAAAAEAKKLDENELAGVAIAAHELASWVQSVELSAVARISARTAAADRKIGLEPDGRPAGLGRDAVGQVSLALTLTDYSATAWADLAVTLTWRLPATGKALAGGRIDLARAKVIAEATSVLSEPAARAVEAEILPGAGQQTAAQLRMRLRRAVIAADPEGAERRWEEAERHAKVSLYGEDDGTATLTGARLPAVQAAAAMARITAIAKAMKAAGQAGGLDLHRAKVMLGLLLGTLPYIPPPGDTPEPPPPGDTPEPSPPGDSGPGDGPDSDDPGQGEPQDDLPAPRDEDAPDDDGLDRGAPDGPDGGSGDDDDDLPMAGPVPPWPDLGAIPPALARSADRPADGRPVPGLLDVTLPWTTLTGLSAAPGVLGRIGPITAAQGRQLAQAAETDPAAQWRVIVTNAVGQAITVTRIRRIPARARAGPGPPGPGPPGAGLVGRITLTITRDNLRLHATNGSGSNAGPGPPGGMAGAALRAAARALDRALDQARADAAAGGCAHHAQSSGYRPPPRLREQVTARDLTCRYLTCRQAAWRADLDHTIPYDNGGRTCPCNLGGGCRRHHQLKQHPRWMLEQTQPGHFTWTTPAGRTYTVGPDVYPV
jgi:Domain of unknown function (DUF222)